MPLINNYHHLNRPWITLTRVASRLAVATAATLAVVLVLSGCTETVRTVTRDVPRPAPTPSLIGTWTSTEQDRDDDGSLKEVRVYTLTFTKSRAIWLTSVRDTSGREIDRWNEADTWSATDTTVTRTRHDWDDENRRFHERSDHVAKNYAFADEGKTLLIHVWNDERPTTHYWRYTRVETPIQDLFTGAWEFYDERDDGTVNWRLTISFSGGSFTYRNVRTEGESVRVVQLEGPYEHDVENGFILVTISAYTRTVDGAPSEDSDEESARHVGHTLRWAYAPTERPDQIAVSLYGSEQTWNQSTRMWDYRNDVSGGRFLPSGNYNVLFKRPEQ